MKLKLNKVLEIIMPWILSIIVTGLLIGGFLLLAKCSEDSQPEYEYRIEYVIYYPQREVHKVATGRSSLPPSPSKKVSRGGRVRLKVGFDEIYKGTSDIEVVSFTYKQIK